MSDMWMGSDFLDVGNTLFIPVNFTVRNRDLVTKLEDDWIKSRIREKEEKLYEIYHEWIRIDGMWTLKMYLNKNYLIQ